MGRGKPCPYVTTKKGDRPGKPGAVRKKEGTHSEAQAGSASRASFVLFLLFGTVQNKMTVPTTVMAMPASRIARTPQSKSCPPAKLPAAQPSAAPKFTA